MRLAAALLTALALVACKPQAPAPVGPVPDTFRQEQALCEKRGGRWGAGGAAAFFVCNETTRDGGKSCAAKADCEGLCLARSRSCAPVKPLFGCNEVLNSSGRAETICID
jgi:hypothetical protein